MLPFVNAGADPHLEYLTDGITESIINSLSQLPGLRVVPRSLVFRYKGLQADPATVGLALNARTILTGRVAQQGDVLNIQAELVDTATESQLWGEQFRQQRSDLLDGPGGDRLADLRSAAAEADRRAEDASCASARPSTRRRHQEYLRGRYHWNNLSPDSFRRALEHFERGDRARSGIRARPMPGLGDAFGAMAYYGFVPPDDGFPRAALPPSGRSRSIRDMADAHVHARHSSDCSGGGTGPPPSASSRRRIELNPKLALAHCHLRALPAATGGRHDEALAQARLARELDPLSLVHQHVGVAWVHHFAGRPEAAVARGADGPARLLPASKRPATC